MDKRYDMFVCNAWTKETSETGEKCKENGGGESGMVKQLLSMRKSTPAVLDIIVATEAGQRAKRQEQERRQKERERDET